MKQYQNGNIWGIALCKPATPSAEFIKVKGTFTRLPVLSDTLVLEKYEVHTEPRYGKTVVSPLIHVQFPTDAAILKKYVVSTANLVDGIERFGATKLSVLLHDPSTLWTTLALPAPEWPPAYDAIPEPMRAALHENFKRFEKDAHSTHSTDVSIALLMMRLNIKLHKSQLKDMVAHVDAELKADADATIEGILESSIFDLMDIVPSLSLRTVLTIAKGLSMSLQTVDALECLFVLKENEDDGGHTWMSRANIPCRDATLQFLQSMEKVYIHGKRVFRMTTYEDEGYIATFVNERRDASPCFSTPSDTKGDLTEEQQQAVANAFRHRVSLITGGPGTGKTHTIKGMLNYLESISQLGGNVALLAPTGKAVSRIMTMLNKDDYSQYNIQTSTIHRFMYQDMVEYNDEGVTFIVIDEMSMVDVPTFARLLRFIHTHHEHAHIVLVGDPDQLPSIGCGNILADIISSDALPHVQLTKVQRQEEGGDLLAAIYTVKGGAAPRFRKDSPDFIYGGDDPVSYIENIAAEYRDRPQDLLIITPRNYVIRQLQPRVRAIMNPNASSEGLCQGDRVIQKVNTYETMTEQPRFNGMIGTVQDIQISTTTVTECVAGQKIQRELDLSKIYVAFDHFDAEHILTQQESKDELDFAYILTVHKSQGSQAHTVVVLVDDESSFFLTRNLIYTAISRAEKKCIVVGSIEAYVDAIKRESPKRRTCLANWLRV